MPSLHWKWKKKKIVSILQMAKWRLRRWSQLIKMVEFNYHLELVPGFNTILSTFLWIKLGENVDVHLNYMDKLRLKLQSPGLWTLEPRKLSPESDAFGWAWWTVSKASTSNNEALLIAEGEFGGKHSQTPASPTQASACTGQDNALAHWQRWHSSIMFPLPNPPSYCNHPTTSLCTETMFNTLLSFPDP